MPRETCQYAGENATAIEVVWSKPEGGGNLQLHFRRVEAEEPEVDQYSDQLSRADCNRLIRALRRARDAVYGTDA